MPMAQLLRAQVIVSREDVSPHHAQELSDREGSQCKIDVSH